MRFRLLLPRPLETSSTRNRSKSALATFAVSMLVSLSGNNNASPKDGVQWRGNRTSNGQCNGTGCGLRFSGLAADGEGGGGFNGSEESAAAGPDQLEGPGSIENDTIHLKRRVGLVSGVALIVGTMIGELCEIGQFVLESVSKIGSGIFVSPSGLLERTGSIGMSFIIWMSCGLLSLLGESKNFHFRLVVLTNMPSLPATNFVN
jgi:L-type amino acid transporter 9